MRGPIVDGIKDRAFEELSQLKIPTKYVVFAWRLLRDRLPIRINLHRRQIDILDRHCPFCSREEEEEGHLFFHCNRIIRIWWESLSWVNKSAAFPKDPRQHFLQHGDILNEGRRATRWMAVTWTIWQQRNMIVFSNETLDNNKLIGKAAFLLWTRLRHLEKDFLSF
ncbi:uncharacterized protein LOC114398554 [Glycine soja]|uniref:uncharacterized protein n=1 Tax=Glycine max TaxID=3847 RepID=UPI0003DE9E7B|nr:uncharacterized protein LOC102663042 [Glycine max]XP_028216540.1 uncharacterized protein LOC114398554 [Glycine soja]|eukprot:XP_006605027.1 uncharacterized protein LOC102663042 [Glycine max]